MRGRQCAGDATANVSMLATVTLAAEWYLGFYLQGRGRCFLHNLTLYPAGMFTDGLAALCLSVESTFAVTLRACYVVGC